MTPSEQGRHAARTYWNRVRAGEVEHPSSDGGYTRHGGSHDGWQFAADRVDVGEPVKKAPKCAGCQGREGWAVFPEGGLWYCADCIEGARWRAKTEIRRVRNAG